MADRVILHCDCNSFFASVETALNPAYRGVPMAVCGSESDRHGIVLAKNELAKKFGIQTAETVHSARKKCPNLVIASPHYDEYTKYSRRVNEIYARYTDMIEPFGIDESWLDVTASRKLFGTGEEIAERIRREVKEEVGITVSIGVSFNKVYAKLGSDYKKPDAITVISRENFEKIAYPLPVSDLLFVGKRTADELLSIGVRTIGDLAKVDKGLLVLKFGKAGEQLYRNAHGLDDSPVARVGEHEDQKSIGFGFTFRHNLESREECKIAINYLSDDVARRLRKSEMVCHTVQLTIKDEHLAVIQRQRTLKSSTDIAHDIAAMAYNILIDEWSESRPIRMLTVTAQNLARKEFVADQIDIFSDSVEPRREKDKKQEETVDKIRQKYGRESITNGAILTTDIGIKDKKVKK
ncbi:MAG: DNA polymerase IV [Clostridia bacterium]|nr:DNA polymerase IV [Clostridia bacterium]